VKYKCTVLIELHYIPELYIQVCFYRRKMETINVTPNMKKLYFDEQSITSNERNFLICSSCFWCASYLNSKHRSIEICPTCNDANVESMPISFDETYNFDYDSARGVTLEFGRTR